MKPPIVLRGLRRTLRPYRPAFRIPLAALLGSVLWVLLNGYLAARDLQAMQSDIGALGAAATAEPSTPAGDPRRLLILAQRASNKGAAAQARTDDVIWKLWARVPVVGTVVEFTTGVGRVAGKISDGPLASAAQGAAAVRTARTSDGRLDLESLARQSASLSLAATTSQEAANEFRRLARTGISAIDTKRDALQSSVTELATRLHALQVAAQVGPDLLGQLGARRYLIAVQNNAESRASGGIVSAYGVLRLTHGKPVLEYLRSDADLKQIEYDAVDLGREWRLRYQRLGQARDWREVTTTPDFPTAAKAMLGLWSATHSGERLAGVLSVDPVALANILQATGPLRDKHGVALTSKGFVRYALIDAYALYPDKGRRTDALADAAHAVFDAVVAGSGGTSTLAERLGNAVVTRHLLFYDASSDLQRQIATTALAGSLPIDAAPFLCVITQDAIASKLSAYLRRSIHYHSDARLTNLDLGDGRGQQPVQRAVLTIVLRNTAPSLGLPAYVAPATDLATGGSIEPGVERISVSAYLARNGLLDGATLDGHKLAMTSETEQGLSVLSTAITLPPGGSATLTLSVIQPALRSGLRVLNQPLAVADDIVVD